MTSLHVICGFGPPSNQKSWLRLCWQGCVLSPLLFIVYMNWIDKCSQADECTTIRNFKISRLLFVVNLVLLSSTESGLQRALNSFADICDTAGMELSTAKTEVFHLSRNPDQCVLQVNGATLKQVEKFKYLGVAITCDGKYDELLDTRIGKTSAECELCTIRLP